jgi:tetratricopeptide (TPR) repeat protein
MQKLQEWRSRSPEIVNKDMMDDIAGYLDRSGKKLEAIEVLKVNIEAFPESISAQRGLGVIYLDVGEGKKALEIFEKILEKEPDNTFVKGCIPWTREMIQAEENPVSLSDEILQKYAGDYGPRHVTFREGNLYYQRDGNDEFLLIPLNDNTFMLKNYGRFRLSFVADEDGRIEKIVGLYIEGRTDESIRDE